MRPLSQGTPRCVDARAHRRAYADGRLGRSRAASRVARLIGAIVAGGAASRFAGEAKGLHTVGGKRIIDRVAAALSAVTSDLIVISSAPGADQWLPGTRVIPDAWRKQASLVGIHTALSFAHQPILVVAWDMPFVSRPLLELIADRSSKSIYATIPVGENDQLEPFCAMYTPECLPTIEKQLAADDLRLSRLLELLPSYERIQTSEVAQVGQPSRLFFNVNTAEDLVLAERMATEG